MSTVPELHLEGIWLWMEIGKDRRWHDVDPAYPGAELFYKNFEGDGKTYGALVWPARLQQIELVDVIMSIPEDLSGYAKSWGMSVEWCRSFIDRMWPIAERQTILPSGMPVRFEVQVGAQLRALMGVASPEAIAAFYAQQDPKEIANLQACLPGTRPEYQQQRLNQLKGDR